MQRKNRMILMAGAAVAVLGAAGLALAERGPDQGMGREAGMMLNFEAMDVDKDGRLTEAEITAWRAARLAEADADGDGKLNATELAAMHETQMKERMAERAARMIERADADGDGLLSAEELAAGPRQMSMFERIDADGDGAVTQAELDAAREKMAGRFKRHGGGMGPDDMMPDMGPEN